MKPVYEVKAWREGDWWLVRVVGASDGADPGPVNALTQARTLANVDPMARDLVATILDASESIFDIAVAYDLPDDVGEFVHQAKALRAWADQAKELWQVRSAAAARALADKGYSLREAAVLLGLSHQRVDQLLNASDSVMEREFAASLADYLTRATASPHGTDVIFVVSGSAVGTGEPPYLAEMDPQFKEEVGAALLAWRSRATRNNRDQETRGKDVDEAPAPDPRAAEVISRGWAVVQA